MEKGGGGAAASSRADATSSFTVFVSPPWSVPSSIKHVTFSEAFPAIGGLGGSGGRRVRMTLSRSLESIPENAVWHAGKSVGVGTAGTCIAGGAATSRDTSASARGALLPPIRQTAAAIAGGDLDLPEMRARAFSDPNAYQATSTRDRHQHATATSNATTFNYPIRAGETGISGGLAKLGGPSSTTPASAASTATPRPLATPPKKPPSPKQTRKAAAPATSSTAKRSQHESNGGGDDADSPSSAFSTAGGQSPSKERADVRLGGGGGGSKAAIAADRVLNALATDVAGSTASASHRHTTATPVAVATAAAGHSSLPSAATNNLRAGGGSGAAATSSHAIVTAAAAGNGSRGRMSTVAAATGDLPSPPPLAATQRNHSKAAASGAAVGFFDEHAPTTVQPRIVHPPNIDRGGRGHLNRHARHADKEVDTSRTAFALVGSPGRRLWPSPHREATSFISATPQGRPMAAAATAASFGGSHSYSGPTSPLAAAAAREDAVRSGGSSEESLNWSGSGDVGRWCSAASMKTLGAIDIPSAAAAGAVSAGACSKEFQTILSGFIASGTAASAGAIGRDGAYGRDGRQAPDDILAETRAHFLRAGCRPISDSL